MQQIIKVIEGVDYFQRETANGYLEIKTGTLVNTLAAVQHKNDEGYELVLEPSERDSWPFGSGRQNVFYMRKKGEANVNSVSIAKQSPQKEEAEGQDNKNNTVSGLSAEELLEGPDWKAVEKLGKQAMEDEADRWSIQIDTAKTKKEMLEDFKAAWADKSQAV